jgi:hypothetical protein
MFTESNHLSSAEAMAEVLKQSDEFDIEPLVPVLTHGLASPEPLLALTIASGLSPKGYARVADASLWEALAGHLLARQEDVVNAVAKFVMRVLDDGESFPFDPEFFVTVLNVLSAPDTPFSMCKNLIMLLVRACLHRPILVFLEKRQFGAYLVQLPWRYPDDSAAVFETIEKTATLLQRFHSPA